MKKNKEKEKALEIAKKYPIQIKCFPRESFIEQLADFILKQQLK